jgi:hypothetical protein
MTADLSDRRAGPDRRGNRGPRAGSDPFGTLRVESEAPLERR